VAQEVQTQERTWWAKNRTTVEAATFASWGGLVGKWPWLIGLVLLLVGGWLLALRVKKIREARRERLRRWPWATSHRAPPPRGFRRPALLLALAAVAAIAVNVLATNGDDGSGGKKMQTGCELGIQDGC